MNIIRSGSQPSRKGPDSWFTGDVRIDAPFQASEPAKVGGATVTFEPGARTAWHTHPLGQTLISTLPLQLRQIKPAVSRKQFSYSLSPNVDVSQIPARKALIHRIIAALQIKPSFNRRMFNMVNAL